MIYSATSEPKSLAECLAHCNFVERETRNCGAASFVVDTLTCYLGDLSQNKSKLDTTDYVPPPDNSTVYFDPGDNTMCRKPV